MKPESVLDGKVTLHRGDCLDVLPTLEENSVDSVVCDPPYHLTSIVKRFGKSNLERDPETLASPIGRQSQNPYGRVSKGFMGKQWDGGGIAFDPETWALVLRVLKPGGHLLAFSGTRTYHRMACAIEDAGFEIRDQIGWCYGSGFPKSHDVSKGIDRAAGAEREKIGRVAGMGKQNPEWNGTAKGRAKNSFESEYDLTAPATESAIQWQGWGTALKPAWEPICLARKPLSESSIAANVLKHGTGGINVDGCRVGTDDTRAPSYRMTSKDIQGGGFASNKMDYSRDGSVAGSACGRWPANLIHDGSEEVLAGFPETQSGNLNSSHNCRPFNDWEGSRNTKVLKQYGNDSGSAARFFYTAKADSDDRLGSKHPTVKPLDLMQYLVRLVTPKGGVVLDPFAGTGTTAEAAWREEMRCVLIEREAEYQADIVKRMGLCLAGPDQRRAASIKQEEHDTLPLFCGGKP